LTCTRGAGLRVAGAQTRVVFGARRRVEHDAGDAAVLASRVRLLAPLVALVLPRKSLECPQQDRSGFCRLVGIAFAFAIGVVGHRATEVVGHREARCLEAQEVDLGYEPMEEREYPWKGTKPDVSVRKA
jgi:hypothetical protein